MTIVSVPADGIFVPPGPLYQHSGKAEEQIRSDMLLRPVDVGRCRRRTRGRQGESLDLAALP
jgi:hypothetical protein